MWGSSVYFLCVSLIHVFWVPNKPTFVYYLLNPLCKNLITVLDHAVLDESRDQNCGWNNTYHKAYILGVTSLSRSRLVSLFFLLLFCATASSWILSSVEGINSLHTQGTECPMALVLCENVIVKLEARVALRSLMPPLFVVWCHPTVQGFSRCSKSHLRSLTLEDLEKVATLKTKG